MIFPVFKIDLCQNGANDKVFLEGLRYSDADLAAYPKPDYAKEYSTDMFQYVNKIIVTVADVKDNSSSLVSAAFEGMNLNAGDMSTNLSLQGIQISIN